MASSTPARAPTTTALSSDRSEENDNGKGHGLSPVTTMSDIGSAYSSGSLATWRPPNERQSRPYVPEARLVHLYYGYFHQAHPILAPAAFFDSQKYPDYLYQVVRFIGSHYSKVLCGDDFLERTTALLLNTNERSPTMVQALLLFSIMMSARNSRTEAVSAMSRAVSLALDLGMYQADFAERFADGHDLQVESLRRTWWELFIWEISMALPDCKITLRCSEVSSHAYLPCEDATYASTSRQMLPPPQTFSAFRARLFNQEGGDDDGGGTEQQQTQLPSQFSSYSYRIEAFHILARVMVLNTAHETHPDHLQSVANMIVSWCHLLPCSKVDIVDMYGNIDEMLFQAQFTMHYASALLHVPRSNLRPRFPSFPSTICPETPIRLSPSLTRHIHDVKAIESSKELSNLLSVHSKPQGYSPSMIQGAVLSGLVQLAAGNAHASECFEHHQNRVILVLATLGILKMQWGTAMEAYRHLKAAAAANMVSAASTTAASPTGPTMTGQEDQAQRRSETYRALEDRTYAELGVSANYGSNAIDAGMNANNLDSIDRFFMSGLLSPHIDLTCGAPLALNQFAEFD